MRLFALAAMVLASFSGLGAGQRMPKPEGKYDTHRCKPKFLSESSQRKPSSIRVRKGEKATGYSPIIAFEILESGEVVNARVQRSSGMADVDSVALASIRDSKYNKRPGCGVIETKADVTIDWR